MTYWDDFQTRCNIAPQQQYANQEQQKTNDVFSQASDVATVIYNGITSMTVRLDGNIGKNTSGSSITNTENTKKIIFQPITQIISIGDKFTFQGYDWLVTSTSVLTGMSHSCIVKRCNTNMKWIDSTKTLQNYPCIIETVSNKREDTKEFKYLILAVGKYVINVNYNSDTSKIVLGQRFIFNNQAFRISYIDVVSAIVGGVGLIEFIADIDTVGINDNPTLGIADYYQNQHNYTMSILNGASASLQLASTLQLDVQVLDNSVVVQNPVLTFVSSAPSICSVNSSGVITASTLGNSTITVTFGSISKSISATAISSSVNNYTIDINGLLAITLSTPQSYTAAYKNNGNVYTDTSVLWWLTGDDGILSTNLATITYNGNNCTVKANSSLTGYVKLYTKNANSVQSYVRLQIKNLW